MSAGYSTTDTFASLIEEIRLSLSGFGVDNDLVTALSNDVASADVIIGVTDSSAVSRGIIEIDEEILYVQSNNNGVLTIAPFGRGYKGTAATTHTAGAMVSISPTFPRSTVSRAINQTIQAVYPDLFSVKTYEFTTDSVYWQYNLPADVERVLLVESKWAATDGWEPVREWDVTHSANTTDHATGKFIALGRPYSAGVTIHVTYAARPTLLANAADEFSATTGLPATARDVVVLGTAVRLMPWLDTGRVPTQTVSSDLQDQNKPIGNAVSLAREMRQQYQLALQREREVLQTRYPLKVRRTR